MRNLPTKDMTKIEEYKRLVERRKNCRLCNDNLFNPAMVADGLYDSGEIGPWSLWQGTLNAQLFVVGQDWGDTLYFEKWQGKDQPSGNPTNENLQRLLEVIGVQVGKPREYQAQIAFFTNLILCLKSGGLQAPVKDDWFINCSREFFKPLVEIIRPRAIIALGKKVSEWILNLYDIGYPKNGTMSKIMRHSPYQLIDSTALFPLYHCGAGSVNRNRSMSEQIADWVRVKEWLKGKSFR
jgi:DNA polymerase